MLTVYSDGAAHGRSGWPGGWAFAVVRDDAALLESSGAQRRAASNEMELRAAIAGLHAVLERGWHLTDTIALTTDSLATVKIANGTWAPRTPDPLAEALRAAAIAAGATARWVKGHAGNRWNERVDALAGAARESLVPARVKRRKAR
jgi:ribonuclease HI